MHINTPSLASHLVKKESVTKFGKIVRSLKLDELPQLFSIIQGNMSFVGPRPALYNQDDLIKLRNEEGIDELIPGLTGWAQINGRDDVSIAEKVALDKIYKNEQSFWFDIKIVFLTVLYVLKKRVISH